jgi:hypothetical protein
LRVIVRNVGSGPAIDCRYGAVYYSGTAGLESGGFISNRLVIATGETADSSANVFGIIQIVDSGTKERANMLFGGTERVENWVKACGQTGSFVREVIWCSDVLNNHWWFARSSAAPDLRWGEGNPPDAILKAVEGLG